MGMNCNCYLPSNVRVEDVAHVMAVLMGKAHHKENFTSGSGWATWLDDRKCVEYKSTTSPCFIEILIKNITGDALKARGDAGDNPWCSFFFHCERKRAGKFVHLYPKSTAFWIAICKGLVDFFGGEVNYCDVNDDINYKKKAKTWQENCPSNNPDWEKFQTRMLELKPLTLKDFEVFSANAGYPVDFRNPVTV